MVGDYNFRAKSPAAIPPTHSGFNYRLATHPQTGVHGYEVGCWPDGVDQNNPDNYEVFSIVLSQQEAQTAARQFDANPPQRKEGEPAQIKTRRRL